EEHGTVEARPAIADDRTAAHPAGAAGRRDLCHPDRRVRMGQGRVRARRLDDRTGVCGVHEPAMKEKVKQTGAGLKNRTYGQVERQRSSFNNRMRRAITSGRIFPFLALTTLGLAVIAGVLVWLIDHKDFHTLGDAMWWSIVTLATVGYGDIVPH